jgi:hypothetical protein
MHSYRSTLRRHQRAIAGLALVLAITLSAAGCTSGNDTSSSTTVTTAAPETTTTAEPPLQAGREVFVFTPGVGQCFDRRRLDERPATGPQQTDIVLVLDCSLPHQNEIFDVLAMPGSPRDYPGESAMHDFARNNCTTNFMSYVGRPYEVSALEVGYYLPSSSEWDQGARTLGCYVSDVNGDKLVGSARGSSR